MSEQGLHDALQAAIREETGQDSIEIAPGMTANDIPGWDSLAHVRILMNVEERVGKPISIKDTYAAADIGQLLAILKLQVARG